MNQGCLPLLVFLFTFLPGIASACAVCMGGDDANLRNASNSTLWALLSLVGFIFLATASTAFFLLRKAKHFKSLT
jgi:hypothetical protein